MMNRILLNCFLIGLQLPAFSMTVNISVGQQPLCSYPNGELHAYATGGVAPYTYLWSNGATSQSIMDVQAGSYTVTVTDANSEQATDQIELESIDYSAPNYAGWGIRPYCAGAYPDDAFMIIVPELSIVPWGPPPYFLDGEFFTEVEPESIYASFMATVPGTPNEPYYATFSDGTGCSGQWLVTPVDAIDWPVLEVVDIQASWDSVATGSVTISHTAGNSNYVGHTLKNALTQALIIEPGSGAVYGGTAGTIQLTELSPGDYIFRQRIPGLWGSAECYDDLLFTIPSLDPEPPIYEGVWIQRPSLPGPVREGPISFAIGNTGYVGGGTGTSTFTDLWAYDPVANTWTAKAALPGSMVAAASLNGVGYGLRNTPTDNFWAYDPQADAWSPRADMPVPRSSTVAFGLEGRLYITTGNANGNRLKDLWAYDPDTDTWTQKADKSGQAVFAAAGFALGNKGYVMGGNTSGSSVTTSSAHRYDPATDTWSSISAMAGNAVQFPMAMAIGNVGYCGGGVWSGGQQTQKSFRGYDPATNTWNWLPDMGGGHRRRAGGFSIGGSTYISCGLLRPDGAVGPLDRVNDLWEYQPALVHLSPRVFLGGPYDQASELMDHALNTAGLVPDTDPYALLLASSPGGDYSDLFGGLEAMAGNDAIVDRVVVELRDANDPSLIRAARHVWVQRDGDVVDMDGISSVRFTMPPGNYHVAIRHRNHLGCMSADPLALSATPTSIDFTAPATATWGTDARKNNNGTMTLWPGDANFDGQVKYTGTNNDRDVVLIAVGGSTPTNVLSGVYSSADVNMDGDVKYTGTGNDRDVILQTIGGVVPTAVRTQQVP